MDGLFGFSAASLSVGTALGYALRDFFPGRARRNIPLALFMFVVAVALPFLIPAGWFLFLSIVAQVPLVALAMCLAGRRGGQETGGR